MDLISMGPVEGRDWGYSMLTGIGRIWGPCLDKVKHIYLLRGFLNMLRHEHLSRNIAGSLYFPNAFDHENLSHGGAHKIERGQKNRPGLEKCRFHGQRFLKEIKLKAGGRLLKMKLCVDASE